MLNESAYTYLNVVSHSVSKHEWNSISTLLSCGHYKTMADHVTFADPSTVGVPTSKDLSMIFTVHLSLLHTERHSSNNQSPLRHERFVRDRLTHMAQ